MKNKGNCWPSARQKLLLQAILWPDKQADTAWTKYCKKVDLQKVEYVSSNLLPLVFHRKKESHTPELQVCKSIYRHTWAQNHLLLYQLLTVTKAFQAAGIQFCLLKGAAMIAQYYQDAGLRVVGDIDMLISRQEIDQVIKILKQLGWTLAIPAEKDLPLAFKNAHAITFKNKEGQMLDVHWFIFSETPSKPHMQNYQPRICESKVPQTNLPIFVLSPEDQMVHTLLHGLKYSPQPLIRWVTDAAYILKKTPAFDWEYFWRQAQCLKMEFRIQKGIVYLADNQFVAVPKKILAIIKAYHPASMERVEDYCLTTKSLIGRVWTMHQQAEQSCNFFVLLVTLPRFLKGFWSLDHWHQLPMMLWSKMIFNCRKKFT